jgi:hypothetical protein
MSTMKGDLSEYLTSVPGAIIKQYRGALSGPLTNIINCSISSGKFPTKFKDGKITTTYKKKGPVNMLTNDRPITSTMFISKLLERVV